jgi:L-aminopeptidase/D-esterase-like protein
VLTDVEGVRVGHWADPVAGTGCTVVLLPEGTVASGEVRGGAPATREFALLEPGRLVSRIDALVLTGGSAFGLAAADGVVRWCEEQGRGFATGYGKVPIVVALALFDLDVGDPTVRPTAADGHAAALDAAGPLPEGPAGSGDGTRAAALGRVGAGTGATVGEGVPGAGSRPAGLVTAVASVGDLRVATLVAVNASGLPGGDPATIALDPSLGRQPGWTAAGNTVIGVVATNARLDKAGCHTVAQGAHDGLARAVFPPHTRTDGDAFVAASVPAEPPVEAPVDAVRALAAHVVATAILTLA